MKNAAQFPKVREASLEDYFQISSLQFQYGLKVKSFEEWSHLWTGNPVYQQLKREWPIGWVLENREKQILGSIENVPLSYEFRGKKIIVSTGRNWVVDSQHRSYSPLLLDYYFSQKKVDLFIEGGVSLEAFHAFTEFHTSPVPNGALNQSSYWITDYPGFVATALTKREIPLARLLSHPLGIALFCKDRFWKGRGLLRQNGINVEICTHFDDRFDDFWEQLTAMRSNVLLGLRTREILEWHFKFALLRSKAWILTSVNGSHLVSYAIFDRNDNRRLGLKRMILVDFQSLDGNYASLLPMLSWALRRCEKEGIHTLDIRGFCPEKRSVIEQIVPYRRKLPWWLYVYKAGNEVLEQNLRNPNVWDPSPFDGDSTL
jgi:hypothetical protein